MGVRSRGGGENKVPCRAGWQRTHDGNAKKKKYRSKLGGSLDSGARFGIVLAHPREEQVWPVLQQQPAVHRLPLVVADVGGGGVYGHSIGTEELDHIKRHPFQWDPAGHCLEAYVRHLRV